LISSQFIGLLNISCKSGYACGLPTSGRYNFCLPTPLSPMSLS
jgi:hypothetical protein